MFSKIKKSLHVKRLVRHWRLMKFQPSWDLLSGKNYLQWNSALKSRSGPKILIATSVGAHLPGTILESFLSVALTLRKADVHVLLCDKVLPACLDCVLGATIDEKMLAQSGPQKYMCESCFKYSNRMFRSLGIKVHLYSEYLKPEDVEQVEKIASSLEIENIKDYKLNGIAVGEHALAGTLRFYARGELEGEKFVEENLRRYFKAALLTTFVLENLLKEHQFECAVFHHGIYVPQGLIGEVCRARNVRVVNWNPAYRKKCFIFSHGDTYHHTLMDEPVSKWENMTWTSEHESQVMEYLKSRWKGSRDWIWFHEKPKEDISDISCELGVDFDKPSIGLLTNVFWDAQLHYPTNAFSNMLEWLIETIRYFVTRPEIQLLIRIHPAEVRGAIPSRQPIIQEISKAFPELPKNIVVIPPESQISTYATMSMCNAAIIYGTKTGVELTSTGMPVVVAGEAWIRNKGLTLDAKTKEDYFKILNTLPFDKGMDEDKINRARKYAFHFFFRRMIYLDNIGMKKGWPPYRIEFNDIDEIMPQKSMGLDVVCDGILNGSDFIFPAEKILPYPYKRERKKHEYIS